MAQTVTAPMPRTVSAPVSGARLVSLDVLRGITIAWMIMVNNNGGPGNWPQMEHADWNGFTATDLVFPTFLFVVGASIVFAFEARLAKGVTRVQLAWQATRRAGSLFLLGIVVNGFPLFEPAHLRVYGVLQRIALCYLVVALFYLWDRRVSSKIAVIVAALAGYWVLLRWVPVPGAGVPGRDIPFLDKTFNIVAWLDRHLMPGHLYEDWPLGNMRDPEGLLSTIPAIATTLIGLLAGVWLRGYRSMHAKTQGLFAGAVICLILGYAWSFEFPLNKKLWTSSYVLVSAGWSLAIMALVFWAIEQRGWGKSGRKGVGWTRALTWPWLVFGSNAITAYMISELLWGTLDTIHFYSDGERMEPLSWIRELLFAYIPNAGWAAFSYSIFYTFVCFIPVWILYRRRIFLKV